MRKALVFVLLSLIATETILYLFGYGLDDHCFCCSSLGFELRPSRRQPNYGNHLVLENIGTDTMRASHPLVLAKRPYHVLCVGCSNTFGYGVFDDETFIWRLNEMFPNVYFDNGGVPGAGTLQCLMRMQQLIKRTQYDLVLYCMINDHVYRNGPRLLLAGPDVLLALPWVSMSFSSDYDGLMKLNYNYDSRVCWCGDSMLRTVNFAKLFYYKCLSRSRFFRWLPFDSMVYDNETVDLYQGYRLLREIVVRMQMLAEQNGAKFGLVCLDDSYDQLYEFNLIGTGTRYDSLQLARAGFPKDYESLGFVASAPDHPSPHPNALIHDYYARRIAKWLQQEHMLPPEALVRSKFDRRQHPFPEALKPYVDPLDYRDE